MSSEEHTPRRGPDRTVEDLPERWRDQADRAEDNGEVIAAEVYRGVAEELEETRHMEQWWKCPKCRGQTEMDVHGDGPDRYCTECDWEITIPEAGQNE